MEALKVGDTVRCSARHWLRANAMGTIVQFDGSVERGENRWLIEFVETYAGGGIDGNKLWLNDSLFSVEATQ